MTPQGPAVIQIIDLPSVGPGPSAPAAKPAGIHILSAILRRWWVVLLVTITIGGGVFVSAGKLMSASYEAAATIRYSVLIPANVTVSTDPASVIRAGVSMITSERISLLAARDPDLQQAAPWLQGFNLDKPNDRKEVALRMKLAVEAYDDPASGTIQIWNEKPDPFLAAATANAFADGLVQYVNDTVKVQASGQETEYRRQADELWVKLTRYQQARWQLMRDSDAETKTAERQSILRMVSDLEARRAESVIKRMAAKAQLERFESTKTDPTKTRAAWELEKAKLLDQEIAKDSIMGAAYKEQVEAYNDVQQKLAGSMTEQHPEVKRARERLDRAIRAVDERASAIRQLVEDKIYKEMKLKEQSGKEALEQELANNDDFLAHYKKEREELNKKMNDLVMVQAKIQELDQLITATSEEYRNARHNAEEIRRQRIASGVSTVITVDDRAIAPREASNDKRRKVQAAGCAGGLFLGILLALLIDKFDKRLRHPRDIEPILGAPVLGMIPKIQELKRIKGEQAKNLIAEEFRIIRTQLLFGDPQLQHKSICVSSPAPGDGKTSLAVNLAISIAKAGRRTLLVDADLRKPDVHRIFHIPDHPGLAELITGTCEPAAAIRKTDIENLDVLPAGVPSIRPAELLSRPQTQNIMAALGELYEHVVYDSAPLLPVSDTHVLAGLVDGVICSFNADVDRDTIKLVEEILQRCRARLIGTVMNQVKYKQSNTYQRGRSEYDSYYSSPRGASTSAITKPPPEV